MEPRVGVTSTDNGISIALGEIQPAHGQARNAETSQGLEDEEQENGEQDNSISPENEAPQNYPKGLKFYLLTLTLMLAIFMMALDTAIIATAVPSITTEFHSVEDIGWYTSAYLLPLMSLQPTLGKVYTFFGVKPIFIVAMIVFEIGSVICALAPSSFVLILGRVVAGVGAAATYAGGTFIITSAVPLPRIPVYLATLSSMYAVAALTGPPLGGVFTDSAKLTWRFCFWINLPIGFISTVAFMLIYKEPKRRAFDLSTKEKLAKMDLGGTVLFISSIVLLFVALQFGGNTVEWTNARVVVPLTFAAILFAAFVFLQRHLGENATVPPHIFLNRSVSLSVLAGALMSLGVSAHTSYLPFYFQAAKGTSASSSGLRILPYTLGVSGGEIVVGTLSSMLGLFLPFMYFGTVLFTIAASLLCTLLNLSLSTVRLIGFQVLAGVGVGSSMQLCATSVRAAVDTKDIPVAATLTVFAPFFGAAVGAAVTQNVFQATLRGQLLDYMPIAEANGFMDAGTRVKTIADEGLRHGVMLAYNNALRTTFIIPAVAGGVAFACTLCIKWRNLKPKTA
ncbi:major facilitator superfamily transporter [Clohesyomyces aquaticus]|uniref:Major facilitator superfamily transporter n=1 Tax=Clohesyomyces aquaticus TaxID=1231657 RepID=A0A1Y1ZYB4_9PLEO|nr:major facilitator superfamily transporter [Clohesyomyces aquaticus]